MRDVLVLALLALLAHGGVAAAPAPQTWSTLEMSGDLSIANDPVWAKKLQLKLTVYDRASGGDPVWLERVKTRVKDGKFQILAGRTSSLEEVLSTDRARDLWLEVTLVGIDKDRYQDVFAPRVPLTTAEPFGFGCTSVTPLVGEAYLLKFQCTPDEGATAP